MKAYRVTYKEKTENFESFRFEYYADVKNATENVRVNVEKIARLKGIKLHVGYLYTDGTYILRVHDNFAREVSLEQAILPFPVVITEINIQ